MPSPDRKADKPNSNPTPEVFEVQSILQRGNLEGKKYYLVKWKGYSEEQATWEPQSNLTGCTQAILQFQNIIKKIHQKNKTPQSIQVQKRKIAKTQEKQKESIKSKSKEPSKDNLDILASENKKDNKQKKQARQRKQTRVSKEVPNIKLQKNEVKNEFSKKQKDQSHNQLKNSEGQSASENDILEATTAQTIPSAKETDTINKNDKISNKNSQVNLKKEKISPFFDENPNFLNEKQHHKKTNLKRERQRQRQRDESSEKQIQKIKKKYKKSPVEEITQTSSKQYKTQGFPNKNQIKQSTNEALKQQKSHERKQKLKLEKDQESRVEKNKKFQREKDEYLKQERDQRNQLKRYEILQQDKNEILKVEKSQKLRLERIQKLREDKSSDLEREMKTSKEQKIQKHSLRFILCEEELFDFTNEILGNLDKRLKINLNIQDDQGDDLHSTKILPKFVDLSNAQFSAFNTNLLKILLTKDKVEKLDKDGEFLDFKIQTMIKITEQNNGKKLKQWVCVMKGLQQQKLDSKDTRYFVRLDDLKRDSWKKLFRKFMLSNF